MTPPHRHLRQSRPSPARRPTPAADSRSRPRMRPASRPPRPSLPPPRRPGSVHGTQCTGNRLSPQPPPPPPLRRSPPCPATASASARPSTTAPGRGPGHQPDRRYAEPGEDVVPGHGCLLRSTLDGRGRPVGGRTGAQPARTDRRSRTSGPVPTGLGLLHRSRSSRYFRAAPSAPHPDEPATAPCPAAHRPRAGPAPTEHRAPLVHQLAPAAPRPVAPRLLRCTEWSPPVGGHRPRRTERRPP